MKMKNKIIVLSSLAVLLGAGCATPPPTTDQTAFQAQPEKSNQTDTKVIATSTLAAYAAVLFSTGTVPAALLSTATKLPSDGAWSKEILNGSPFKVSLGQTFNLGNGCSMTPSYTNQFTLKSIETSAGKWTLTFRQYGPLNIKVYGWFDEKGAEQIGTSSKEFAKKKPQTTIITISQDEKIEIGYDKGTGAIYQTNGAFVPVFVSRDEIYLKYIALSC